MGPPARECKPKIDYPCAWQYKIIGFSREDIRRVVAEHVRVEPLPLTDSKVSSGGRYVSMNLEITVHSEKERLELYTLLTADPAIKVVL